jgi:uncharacterized protein
MTTVVLDTNVILQSLFATHRSASRAVLDHYFDGAFTLAFSDATLNELVNVLSIPRLKARHQLTDDETLEFVGALLTDASFYPAPPVPPSIVRDITDQKFLSLLMQSSAMYFVTNDRRHLLPLKTYHATQIVTPANFLRAIAK